LIALSKCKPSDLPVGTSSVAIALKTPHFGTERSFHAASQTIATYGALSPSLSPISSMTTNDQWVSASKAAEHLSISTRTLKRWRDAGKLIPGIHYRRKGAGMFAHCVYNLPSLGQRMDQWAAETFEQQ
jgi:hypothetical protein